MSLTFSKPAESGERGTYSAVIPGGLTITVWDMTTGDVSTDYDNGFDLQTNAKKLGLNRVVAVLDAYVRDSSDTVKGLRGIYNPVTGKLMFAETSAATLDQQDSDTDIVDTDIIRMVVLGV